MVSRGCLGPTPGTHIPHLSGNLVFLFLGRLQCVALAATALTGLLVSGNHFSPKPKIQVQWLSQWAGLPSCNQERRMPTTGRSEAEKLAWSVDCHPPIPGGSSRDRFMHLLGSSASALTRCVEALSLRTPQSCLVRTV
ncbi:uncharacterized protein BDW47DRAFT_100098 [Aspergillus candidus]|uniref:Uncharacterized protein n=1 Tax=Aspergillus candidus TaxID=41067 RepID=A0A2I2FL92_ASPCN|nr:hypothetical protein BDW47DRAFT_100098 [Aspergillus candidus]PLB41408.1 hypothetical protein BDW47DRAFT_100098 [Aspergillus candidus]